MYGIQAQRILMKLSLMFENDVKLYGIQAINSKLPLSKLFENDVKLYGIQACPFTYAIILFV